jgi:hypothetical protein
MNPLRKHPTKRVKYKDLEADIDLDIADLVLNLWKLEVDTVNSCQDNAETGFVWIAFDSTYGAEEFLNYVAEYSEEPDSVYQRMNREWGDATLMDWKYTPSLKDHGVDERVESDDTISSTFTGSHGFMFSMSVRFPRADLEFAKERISTAISVWS